MKGYVTDLFWTTGWLLGFGSPLWPFPYQRGSARFLHQFGAFQFVTREFEGTLTTGKRRLAPAVSNLTRLWRLLSPTSIRRLKADFLPDLPAKQRHIHHVAMDKLHTAIYYEVAGAAKDILDRELRRDDPNGRLRPAHDRARRRSVGRAVRVAFRAKTKPRGMAMCAGASSSPNRPGNHLLASHLLLFSATAPIGGL